MIKKVLIAEDHQMANISIQKTLEDLKITEVDYVYYCDDALHQIAKGVQTRKPYDLLITDLSFEPDQRPQQIIDGKALIDAARKIQPALAVLVFTGEGRANVIQKLIEEQQIDGYVRKARYDAQELQKAIAQIAANQRYFPRSLQELIQQKNAHQFSSYDITVIQLLAEGMRQKDIPTYLQTRNIQPSGLSSLEKRLSVIREKLDCANNEQLVAFCKDKGVI
jgi:DNA-binding NarL/FixJ family response regulator